MLEVRCSFLRVYRSFSLIPLNAMVDEVALGVCFETQTLRVDVELRKRARSSATTFSSVRDRFPDSISSQLSLLGKEERLKVRKLQSTAKRRQSDGEK